VLNRFNKTLFQLINKLLFILIIPTFKFLGNKSSVHFQCSFKYSGVEFINNVLQ